MFNRYYNFYLNIKNHLNHFLNIFAFLVHNDVHFFATNILRKKYVSWKKKILFNRILVLWCTILCKKFGKIYAPKLLWLKFKHGHQGK
jgi:hypothetical protein